MLNETCFFIIPQIIWDLNCQNKLTKAWFWYLFSLPSSPLFFSFLCSLLSILSFSLLTKNNKRQIKSQGYSNMILRKSIWANYSEEQLGILKEMTGLDEHISIWLYFLWYNLSLNFQCGCQNALELLSSLKRFWFRELT